MKKILLLLVIFMTSVVSVYSQFSGGNGTYLNPYKISTAEDLDNIRNYLGAEYPSQYFELINDIDLHDYLENTEYGWTPIGRQNDSFFFVDMSTEMVIQ